MTLWKTVTVPYHRASPPPRSGWTPPVALAAVSHHSVTLRHDRDWRSNSASTPSIWTIMRPAGVAVSNGSVALRKATPAVSRSSRRWVSPRMERERRSTLATWDRLRGLHGGYLPCPGRLRGPCFWWTACLLTPSRLAICCQDQPLARALSTCRASRTSSRPCRAATARRPTSGSRLSMAAANVATSLLLVFVLAMGSRYLDGMGSDQ